jgi:hypothetical protein
MFRGASRNHAAFLVDEVSGAELVTVSVPMTVDRYDWKCESINK